MPHEKKRSNFKFKKKSISNYIRSQKASNTSTMVKISRKYHKDLRKEKNLSIPLVGSLQIARNECCWIALELLYTISRIGRKKLWSCGLNLIMKKRISRKSLEKMRVFLLKRERGNAKQKVLPSPLLGMMNTSRSTSVSLFFGAF